ncbi:MAG: ATP-NAD kinase [Gammaproteobacteria bacterium]|nr:ATP-NAD kinase [Gammaproteobacteria bacterium]
MLTIGVLINPIAGVGGPAALKGSDGESVQAAALAAGVTPLAVARMRSALAKLESMQHAFTFKTWGADMGAAAFAAGASFEVVGTAARPTTSADTQLAAQALFAAGIDLLLFAGGDGTARDLLDVLGTRVPVLGVPRGGRCNPVYSRSRRPMPVKCCCVLARGQLVAIHDAEVRDIDEAALRDGRVVARHYGYLRAPQAAGYMQHTKVGGREDEALAQQEIAGAIAADLAGFEGTVVLGPGTTLAAIKAELAIDGTLLGFDVIRGGSVVARDADARLLESVVDASSIVVLTFTGGQGFLLGRGNQQLSPALLRCITKENLKVVATRTKIEGLNGAPLRVDTGDAVLDARYFGMIGIIAGFDDVLLYRVGRGA